MALFNRFFGSHSSHSYVNKKKDSTESPPVWRQHYQTMPENCDVRVVLFRECQRKGQKLLFDSRTVRKQRLTGSVEVDRAELYKEQSDGWGYRYLSPPESDVKQLHEMILGGAGVAHQTHNMKLHLLEADGAQSGLMWSSVLLPPHQATSQQPVRASDQSLGSAFGYSIGSFNVTEPEVLAGPHGPHPPALPQVSSLAASDSGYYSSCSPSSCLTLDSQTELSSHADLPDYGSWCSLQRRWQSVVENSLYNCLSPVPPPGGRPSTVLGLALIIQGPDSHIFLEQNLVLENIFCQLSESVRQGYSHKRRFVSTVYSGYSECVRAVHLLYTLPHLLSPSWHLALASPTPTHLQERLVQDILSIRAELDTKETNFFFSSLVTGVLSHHLGWVETVMPSSDGPETDNSLRKPHSRAVEELSRRHWYSPTRLQHQELHGSLGCPARNTRTLVITRTEEMARKIVFVLSYFIRCSQIFERKLEFPDTKQQTVKYRVNKRNLQKENPENIESPAGCAAGKVTNLARSNSSPTLEPKMSKQSMKKSKSFMCSPSDLDQKMREHSNKLSDRVNFLIGDNENLNINSHFDQEIFHSGVMEGEDVEEDLEKDMKCLDIGVESSGHVITKGVTIRMKAEDEEYSDVCDVTEVVVSSPTVRSSQAAPLASLMCWSQSYMPGCVLQASHCAQPDSCTAHLLSDLSAAASCHLSLSSSQETVCLVGDVTRGDVTIVSTQQSLPVPLSPLVADILQTFTSTASLSLPASTVLTQLEDNLQQLYLQSCILAELLLSQDGFHSLQSLSAVLDLHPCDVPLLLAVAATHTPSVGHKFGLSFAG